MKAIKLKPENQRKILAATPQLRTSDLDAMMKEYYTNRSDDGNPLYFIPDFEDGASLPWGTITHKSFGVHFLTDHMDKIHDQFVEIRRVRD